MLLIDVVYSIWFEWSHSPVTSSSCITPRVHDDIIVIAAEEIIMMASCAIDHTLLFIPQNLFQVVLSL